MIVLIMGASSVYFILQAPIQRIQTESKVLDHLADSILHLQLELNRLDSSGFVTARPKFSTATEEVQEAFKHIKDITYLRESDKALAEAIDVVERLQKLNEENLAQVIDIYDQLYKDAERSLFPRFHRVPALLR